MTTYKRINLGITKVYLTPCTGGWLLIDTGYPTDYKKFIRGIKRLNFDINQIKYLLLTHHHDDHSGFAARLKQELQIPLILHKDSIPPLSRGVSDEEDTASYVTKRLKMLFSFFELFHKEFTFPPVFTDEKDIIIDGDNNEVLRSIGVEADILFTPGHTHDSISVVCDDGTAFVGDAAMNFLRFTGSAYRPIYFMVESEMYASIRKLLDTGAKKILPAHGNPYGAEKLERMLRRFVK